MKSCDQLGSGTLMEGWAGYKLAIKLKILKAKKNQRLGQVLFRRCGDNQEHPEGDSIS